MAEEKKTGSEKSPFWQSVERASQTVAQWPEWKQAGVLARPVTESSRPSPPPSSATNESGEAGAGGSE